MLTRLLVLCVLTALRMALPASCVLALLPGARTRYVGMVLIFERHPLRR